MKESSTILVYATLILLLILYSHSKLDIENCKGETGEEPKSKALSIATTLFLQLQLATTRLKFYRTFCKMLPRSATRITAVLQLITLISTVSAFSPINNNIRRAALVLIDSSASVLSKNPTYSQLRNDLRFVRPQQQQQEGSSNKIIKRRTILDATVFDAEEVTVVSADNRTTVETRVLLSGVTTTKQDDLIQQIETQAELIVEGMMDESCEIDPETGAPLDDICVDEEKKTGFRTTMTDTIQRIEKLVVERGNVDDDDDGEYEKDMEKAASAGRKGKRKNVLTGDALEKGCKYLPTFAFISFFVDSHIGLKLIIPQLQGKHVQMLRRWHEMPKYGNLRFNVYSVY